MVEQISGLFKAGMASMAEVETDDSQNQSMITLLQAGISQNTIEGNICIKVKKGSYVRIILTVLSLVNTDLSC